MLVCAACIRAGRPVSLAFISLGFALSQPSALLRAHQKTAGRFENMKSMTCAIMQT